MAGEDVGRGRCRSLPGVRVGTEPTRAIHHFLQTMHIPSDPEISFQETCLLQTLTRVQNTCV